MDRSDEEYLERFHTHTGPFVVLGYRMGDFARKSFGKGSKIRCVAEMETSPPVSCMIDGIQMSTGCTLGRGLIEVREGGKRSISFLSGRRTLYLSLMEEQISRILKMLRENKIKESVEFVKDGNVSDFAVISDEKG